jgi:dTDP-4-dehydrorhamnose reductase
MLGHKLLQISRERYETWATFRSSGAPTSPAGLFDARHAIGGIEATDMPGIVRAISQVHPDVVIDCIGIVKQRAAAKDPVAAIRINALFPHLLADACAAAGARLVHISTDCVFSGRRGGYLESDIPDAEDLYGRSKLLGEVDVPHAITVRTSMIGRELSGHYGLVDWFLSQHGGRVSGYTRAIFSGFTTIALSRLILEIVDRWPHLSGLYHVSADPISKHDLLFLLNDAYGARVEIVADDTVAIDRSLDSSGFRAATGFRPASWNDMIAELAADPTPYKPWSTVHVS